MHKDRFEEEKEFSFKSLFVPLTTLKAIHWIIFIGFLVYGNMLFNGFVWDDKTYILLNPQVHSLNIAFLFNENLFNMVGQYRPLPAIYFAALYSLFHDTAFFFHFFQLILHITNAVLVFFFLKHFIKNAISLFLSLIFLIHPIQVESVSYIASAGNPLFFLFGISALLLSTKEEISSKKLIIISILLLLSILVRETGILFLIIVIVYRFLIFGRNSKNFLIATVLTTAFYFGIRFGVGGVYFAKPELTPIAQLSLVERLMNLPAVIFYYLKTFFFPKQLAIAQSWIIQEKDLNNFYLPLIIVVLLLFLFYLCGLYLFRINKKDFLTFIFFFIWFTAGLGFHMQIFPLDWTVADRWFYFPIVGILGTLGIIIQTIKFPTTEIKNGVYILAILIIFSLSFRTVIRNTNWSDAITLYNHDIKISNNFDLENNLGMEYLFIQEYDKAVDHFKKSVELFPYEDNIFNVGYTYEKKGDIKNAKEYYLQALKAKNYSINGHKHNQNTYERLGQLFIVSEKPEVAKKFVKEALNDYPGSGSLWLILAVSEYYLDNQESALEAASKAKVLYPGPQSTYIFTQISNKQPIKIITGI